MATKNVNILLKLTDQFTPKLKGTTKEIKEQKRQLNAATKQVKAWGNAANSKFKSVMGTVGKLGAAFLTLGGALSVAGLKSFADDAMELAKVQVQSETLLESALKNVSSIAAGGEAAVASAKAELMEYASALQGVGVIGDEVTLRGMQQLATFGMDTKQVKALSGAMDDLLAKKYGLDASAENATSVATALGKAMNGSTGALAKMGVVLTDDEKKMLEVADAELRAANLAKILEARVGGANEALAATDQGKIQQAANAWGDFKEEVGKKLLAVKGQLAGLFVDYLPAIQEKVLAFTDVVVAKLQAGADWIDAHREEISSALGTIGTVADTVLGALGTALNFVIDHANVLIPILAGVVAGFTAFNVISTIVPIVGGLITVIQGAAAAGSVLAGVMTLMGGPIGLIVAGIGLLVAAGVALYKNWDKVKAVAKTVFGAIKNFFVTMKDALVSGYTQIKDGILNAFTAVKNKIGGIITSIKQKFQPLLDIINTIRSGLSFLTGGGGNSFTGGTGYVSMHGHALGTPYFAGGPTRINEGGRGETVILPSGTQIIPHDVSKKQNGGTNVTVNVTVQGNVIGNRDFMEQTGAYISHRIIAALGVV